MFPVKVLTVNYRYTYERARLAASSSLLSAYNLDEQTGRYSAARGYQISSGDRTPTLACCNGRRYTKFSSRLSQRTHSVKDFNFQPDDPAYSLLVGDGLLPVQIDRMMQSRVVHRSIDPTVPDKEGKQTEDEEEADPDKIITCARLAVSTDGLLTDAELISLFTKDVVVRSMYDEGLEAIRATRQDLGIFEDRLSLPESRRGKHEPEWTCYAHYWKTVTGKLSVVLRRRASLIMPHRLHFCCRSI
jgi:hypothetical protein